ncbi:hypothetical protein Rt10032_c19g6171 [Rhodotorula toruloides]|uniref:Uncharacterized protein n=1 Tax=Rhodotorula toruloides TaxID=5286 RepID=A0A511KRJ3_RHOTO|nr:hypothetical protein Rt10032_c19g6171 [Rhodotorula toruloides]
MADRCITSATSTVYATQTVLSRVPSVTATATFLTVRPVVSLSTYIGTIRGQLTETVFRVRGEETVTATSELAGFATQTLVTSSPLSILYTTICPTQTSSSTTTTTTTTTTPTPSTSSTPSPSSSTTTTPPPSSTRLTTVTVPFSSSSPTSSSSSATALAGSSGSSSGASSHIGAIVGGAVGGAAALIVIGLLGWWFAKKGGKHEKDEYDPFARDEHWDPALGGAGAGALAAGAGAAGRSNRPSSHGAHPSSSKYAEAGYVAAGAGALGYAATHERSRSRDSSREGEKDGFASYAPLPTDGSPQRVKRRVAPAAEQDAYYANVPHYQSGAGARQDDGMTMASVGTGAGALGAASMYDRHHYQQQQAPQLPEIPVERDAYGEAMSPPPGGLGNSPSSPPPPQQGYTMSPPTQHNTAGVGVYPSGYDSRVQGQAYGQPGGYMQYPSSTAPPPGAPSYPTMYGSAAPSYPPQSQHASLPYPGAIDYAPAQQRDLATPASLIPGVSPSPVPSYRSIQHVDDQSTQQQQQRSSPLRVVNEDEEQHQDRFGAEGEVDAYGGLDEGLAYLAHDRR